MAKTQTRKATKKSDSGSVSSKEKIKHAALKLFAQNGYAATRTRDISAEAGINLALLNYYFGSKEELFELLMTEILQEFFVGLKSVLDNERTSIEEKFSVVVTHYTSLLQKQPDLPLFILSEIRARPERLASRVGLRKLLDSFFVQQIRAEMRRKKIRNVDPLQYLINMIALSVFPFIAAPLIRHLGGMNAKAFDEFVDARQRLVPAWMNAMLNVK